jgi:hypothetical protein
MSEVLLNDINHFIYKYTNFKIKSNNIVKLLSFSIIVALFYSLYLFYQKNCSIVNTSCNFTNDTLLTNFNLFNTDSSGFVTIQTISETQTTITIIISVTHVDDNTPATYPLIKVSTSHIDWDTVAVGTVVKNITLTDLVIFGIDNPPDKIIRYILPSGQGYIKTGE